MTAVEELTQRLALLESQLAALREEHGNLLAQCRATITEVDTALVPLDEAMRANPYGDGSAAKRVRTERGALLAKKSEAEKTVRDWEQGDRGTALRQTQEHVNTTRAQLEQARSEARTDDDLAKAESAARFKLQSARHDVALAQDALAHWEGRLADARAVIGAEAGVAEELAELQQEREKLQGDAFLAGGTPDLKDVDRRIGLAEKHLEREKTKADAARAAMPQIEAQIEHHRGRIIAAEERVKEAEGALLAAAADHARRRITDLVNAMRGPLLTLEAADPEGGFTLYRALTECGLRIPVVGGPVAVPGFVMGGAVKVPSWLHSVRYRPDSYQQALQQERGRVLGSVEETL